jgi:hypothetical protein
MVSSWEESADATKITAIPTGSVLIGGVEDASKVEFRLLNFPDFFVQKDRDNRISVERKLLLAADDWRIEIAPTEETPEVVKYLRVNGGYAFTHIGSLRRIDSQPFPMSAATDVSTALGYFLSFACGAWIGPVLAIGIDSSGSRVWEDWGVGVCSSWSSRDSWFDPWRADLLSQVFSGFWRRWMDPVWKEPLALALYWYIGSNVGSSEGIEGAILLAQTALELLAWVLLVEDKKSLNAAGFKRLTAADQIRLLLSWLQVPLSVPPELDDLQRLSREYNLDGPSVLTEIRNGIVHPGDRTDPKRRSKQDGDARIQAWSLAQWYIDLSFLSLFGHAGEYANRLLRGRMLGNVQRVPWSS